MKKNISDHALLSGAREVLKIEGSCVLALSKRIDGEFVRALRRIAACPGRVAVLGIGKSGLVGRKLASTLSSTGTPAVFLHPVECLHGDLGMLSSDDIILALSHSGETEEMSKLIPLLRNRGFSVISITGRRRSRLAGLSDIVINVPVKREACPYNITPTASTTAMLAAGDAMAISLMRLRGFGKADFASLHPGGNLGKVLNMRVRDIMRTGRANPVVRQDTAVRFALKVMTRTRLGATSVVDSASRLTGFFTDGDVRRMLEKNSFSLNMPVSRVMTRKPIHVFPDTPASDAAEILAEKKIDNLPVINPETGAPVGIIDERDLLAEGLR